jgi:hypothetical protein
MNLVLDNNKYIKIRKSQMKSLNEPKSGVDLYLQRDSCLKLIKKLFRKPQIPVINRDL